MLLTTYICKKFCVYQSYAAASQIKTYWYRRLCLRLLITAKAELAKMIRSKHKEFILGLGSL